MCGIAGIIGKNPHPFPDGLKKIMSHRGPDHTNLTQIQSPSRCLQLLHHRLSIIDLSDEANQPFFDETKKFALIFNGEIYNYKELRHELENKRVKFTTVSDTEVLLKAMMTYGLEALPKLNGMFAFAFFDLSRDKMIVARDPFGEKPFNYLIQNDQFIFASEIKFVLEASGRKFNLNGKVVGDYFSSHFLNAREEETFFSGIKKLPAGSFAEVSLQEPLKLNIKYYYRPALNAVPITSIEEASERIRQVMTSSVNLRLRSDVPLGLFLSGGIDSSVLAAISSKMTTDITFLSVVSGDRRYDESHFVDLVAKHLKKESIKINIENNAAECWELLPKMIWHNDEPVISFTSVAYYKMVEAARERGLKVLLTGQGADEVFLGYRKFKFWYYKNLLKKGRLDKLTAAGLSELRNSDLLESFTIAEALRYFPGGTANVKTKAWGQKLLDVRRKNSRDTSNLKQIQYDDLLHYSVPVLLHYEDRLSMAHGAEVRVPFLDKHLVDIGMALSDELKIKCGYSKYILRKTFESMLPSEVIWRRDKKGFTIPQEVWMKQELSGPIGDLFKSDMISYEMGLLDKKQNLDDYEMFKNNKTRVLGFKDIFARISLEKWMQVYGKYLNQEIDT
jgi:asparagine synthase (glutamine-hydrolysing)